MGQGDLAKWIDMALTGLFVATGAIMTFFILLQEGKGGGLTALGGTKAAGVEGVTNPIRRATVYLAILFFTLAIILGIIHRPRASIAIGPGAPAAATPEAAPSAVPASPAGTPAIPATEPKAPMPEAKKIEGAVELPGTKTEATKPAEPPKAEAKKEEPPVEPKKAEAKKEEPAAEPKKN